MGNTSFSSLPRRDLKPLARSTSAGSRPASRQGLTQRPVHSDAVTCLAPVRPGIVISGGRDAVCTIFLLTCIAMQSFRQLLALNNFETGECLRKWKGHDREITKVAYRQKNGTHHVFSASRDCSVRLWQLNGEQSLKSYLGHELAITGVVGVHDNFICSGSRDNSLRLWDVETADCILLKKSSRNLVTHLAWSKSANFLAQSSEDKELKLWDPRDLSLIHAFPQKQFIQTHCDISGDGLLCLSASNGFNGHGCEISCWDVRQRKLLREFHGHDQTVSAAIFLNQQITWKKLVLSVSADHSAKIWNLEDGACLWSEYVPSGGALLSAVGFNDGNVVVCGQNACLCHMQLQGKAGKLFLNNVSMQIQMTSASHSSYALS